MQRSTLIAALAALMFSSTAAMAALPDCAAFLENHAPLAANKLPNVTVDDLKAAGVRVEPARRMQAQGYPWDHDIQVALPPSYDRDKKKHFPVLWVMDGQFFFELAAGIATRCASDKMPEMIVVGIGNHDEVQKRRNFDFSPNDIPDFQGFGRTFLKPNPDVKMGGAPRFLAFLVDDVRAQLAKTYRMADEHILFGHSGGGLFCTYALFARTAAFKHYICGSPSLRGNDYEVFRMEERNAAEHKDLNATVFFAAGDK